MSAPEDTSLVSAGVDWCRLVSAGVQCPVSIGVGWCRLASVGVGWCRLVSAGVGCVSYRRIVSVGDSYRRIVSVVSRECCDVVTGDGVSEACDVRWCPGAAGGVVNWRERGRQRDDRPTSPLVPPKSVRFACLP